MHELTFVQDMVAHILAEAKKNNLSKITEVKLKLGEASGYSADHLGFHFNLAAEGTLAAGAKLEIENVAGKELVVESIAG